MDSTILGVDGEAISGEYRLLGSSSYSQLSLRGQLTSRQCFDFLIDCASRHKRLYGYGIGYDVCQWIKDLTDSQLNRLCKEGQCYTELGLRFYRVIYVPNVKFQVDRLKGVPTNDSGREVDGSAAIVDIMRWHRKPFADLADDWGLGSVDERLSVRAVKEDRPSFGEAGTPLIERYNRSECDMIAELAEEMEHGLRQLGLPVTHPLTCGSVAGRLASQHRVQDWHQDLPGEVELVVQSAFYGGRMQTCRFGKFAPARHYDIRSAYAWAMAQLPDMLGAWVQCPIHYWIPNTWGLVEIEWDIPEGDFPVMPFPHRNKQGYIHYPPRGVGWYWGQLALSALPHYPAGTIRIKDGWNYIPVSSYKPFWYMEGLHSSRMALKAAGDPLAGLLKLIMVSTWGRMCSDGVKHRYGHGPTRKSPTRGLLDWAGMTTSLIQARLLDAIMINPEEFISCCVDGYWTTGLYGPIINRDLGGWDCEDAAKLFLLRQSCYWKRPITCLAPEQASVENSSGQKEEKLNPAQNLKVGEWEASTSGIADGNSVREQASDEWDARGWRGSVPVTDRQCYGLRRCANEVGSFDLLGEFVEVNTVLKLNPGMGRYGHICPSNRSGSKEWERWLPYWPPVANIDTKSEPFTQKFERSIKEEILGDAADEVFE